MIQFLLTSLQELDRLYREDSLVAYGKQWQTTARLVRHAFPGFTIAYAEIHTAGAEREAHGGMRHVLLPQQEGNQR